jgi:hypothetical protein
MTLSIKGLKLLSMSTPVFWEVFVSRDCRTSLKRDKEILVKKLNFEEEALDSLNCLIALSISNLNVYKYARSFSKHSSFTCHGRDRRQDA